MSLHLDRVPIGAIISLIFFCQLVYPQDSNVAGICDIADPTNDTTDPTDTSSRSITLELNSCPTRDECTIKKGESLVVKTFTFRPEHNGTANNSRVDLTVLLDIPVGQQSDKIKTVEFGVPASDLPFTDVCSRIMEPQHCPVNTNNIYQLNSFEFFIGRLLPTGISANVNLTFLLTSDRDVVGCAMVQATLVD